MQPNFKSNPDMKVSATTQFPESLRFETETKRKKRVIFHLLCVPVDLLFLIGAFTYRFVLIPTIGQLAFGLVAIAIALILLKSSGRSLLYALKQQSDDVLTHPSSRAKMLISYYRQILLIAVITVSGGLFLNAYYPDFDKQEKQMKKIEQLFRINLNTKNF